MKSRAKAVIVGAGAVLALALMQLAAFAQTATIGEEVATEVDGLKTEIQTSVIDMLPSIFGILTVFVILAVAFRLVSRAGARK